MQHRTKHFMPNFLTINSGWMWPLAKSTTHKAPHSECGNMTSFMLDVPCCSGKACPRNSQRGLIFDRDRPINSQRCPKFVHTYKHRDLGCVNTSTYTVWVPCLRIWTRRLTDSRRNIQKVQSESSSRTRHTVRVPDLRISGASPGRSPGEKHFKKWKRKFIVNAAHCTTIWIHLYSAFWHSCSRVFWLHISGKSFSGIVRELYGVYDHVCITCKRSRK